MERYTQGSLYNARRMGGGGGGVGGRSKCNEDQRYYDDREADFYSQFLVKCNIQQNEYTCLFHLNSNLEPF